MEACSDLDGSALSPTEVGASIIAPVDAMQTVSAYVALNNVIQSVQRRDVPSGARVLGPVVIHIRPYGCDESIDEIEDDRRCDERWSSAPQSLDGCDGEGDGSSDDGNADGQADGVGDHPDPRFALAVRDMASRDRVSESSTEMPTPRATDLSRVTDGPLAALSFALRDLAVARDHTTTGRIDLSALPAPWADECGGRRGGPEDVTEADLVLEVRGEAEGIEACVWHRAGTLGTPDVDVLLAHSVPSPFGDVTTGATVLDDRVRRAREIPVGRVRLALRLPSDGDGSGDDGKGESARGRGCGPVRWNRLGAMELVRDQAVKAMRPGGQCVLRLQKLNVYGEGGFFARHVDTPHGTDAVGTAVVALPSRFSGGTLVVHRGSSLQRHDLAPCYAAAAPRPVLAWAALYGDCPHEVERVTSGHRVTLTFDMVRFDGEDEPEADVEKEAVGRENANAEEEKEGAHRRRIEMAHERSHELPWNLEMGKVEKFDMARVVVDRTLRSSLGRAEEEEGALALAVAAVEAHYARCDGGRMGRTCRRVGRTWRPLGIVLSHRYAGPTPSTVATAAGPSRWAGLKGVDRALASVIEARGFACRVTPVLVRRDLVDHEYGYEGRREADVIAFGLDDMRRMMALDGSIAIAADDRGKESQTSTDGPFAFVDMVGGQTVSGDTVLGSEWTGNEAQPDSALYLYSCLALLIDGRRRE